MRILVAPDSFKGSLSSQKICNVIETAIGSMNQGIIVDKLPMADGGEGTVESLVLNTEGKYLNCHAMDPLFRPIVGQYGILGDRETAIIEMASVSGLTLLSLEERDPLLTSTYGTGQLILHAVQMGCRKIILGIGGSGTNDGGIGLLSALGVKFLDEQNHLLNGKGEDLIKIFSIDDSNMDNRLKGVDIVIACDVENELLGLAGATHVYGEQKGATEEKKNLLESGMSHFVDLIFKSGKRDISKMKGSGAAGGVAFGMAAFLNVTLSSGFKIISEQLNLEDRIASNHYDLIITGEGMINGQTLNGKLPLGISKLGKKYNIPVIGVVGAYGGGYEPILEEGMCAIFCIANGPMTLEESMRSGATLLDDLIKQVMRLILRIKK